MSTSDSIKIVAIGGSIRPGAMTTKALKVVVEGLRSRGADVRVVIASDIAWAHPGSEAGGDVQDVQKLVEGASAVVLSTPEYHGSYSSAVKLIIENLGFPSILKGKPVALLGVAAGRLGAIKALEHLRSVCAHIGALALPGAVSVPGVHAVFDDDGRCTDEDTARRLDRLADDLLNFVRLTQCPEVAQEQVQRRPLKTR